MTIKQRQWQLYYLGYYNGEIDGKFGPQSREATKKFQSENSLKADGIFGTNTENKSIEIIKKIQKIIGTTIDGLAGNNTKEATKKYQSKNGLTATGIADANTRAKINGDSKTTNTVTVVEKPIELLSDDDFWKSIKYFKKSEFKCKCGGKYCNGYPAEPNHELITVAERVREHFGAACNVSSGVRCDKHNANVGGVTNSRHRLGKAMDFRISGKTAAQVLAYVQKQPEIRYSYAIDTYYVHMDVL